MGGSNADDSDGGSMTGESLGTPYVIWDTSNGCKDVTDLISQSSGMILGNCAVGSMGGAISGRGSSMMESSPSVGMT